MIYLIGTFIALACAAIESVSYIGYVFNHTGIHAYIFYFTSLILTYFRKTYTAPLKQLLFIIAYVASFLYVTLIFAETITYPNFVFSLTHINPFTFQFFIALLWFHTLVINKTLFSKSLLLASLMYVGMDGAGRTLGVIYKGVSGVAQNPLATYSEKMEKVYPGFYPAMQEVAKITPQDSTIYIPPQGSPWDREGNAAMVNYFLYPRRVINMPSDGTLVQLSRDNVYILISKGTKSLFSSNNIYEYGWPKKSIKAIRVWQINPTDHTTNVYDRDYNPESDKWDWGLIEAKYE